MDWHADVESTKHTNRFGEHHSQDATYFYEWEHVYQAFKDRLNGLFDLKRIDEIVERMLEIESYLKCGQCGTKFQGQAHESMDEEVKMQLYDEIDWKYCKSCGGFNDFGCAGRTIRYLKPSAGPPYITIICKACGFEERAHPKYYKQPEGE